MSALRGAGSSTAAARFLKFKVPASHPMSDSASDSPRTILVCCVGHKPPDCEPPLGFTMICPGDIGMPSALVVPDDRFSDQFHCPILSEYTQLFDPAEYLQSLPATPTELYIFQYRKFAKTRIGSAYATRATVQAQ